MIDRLQKNVPCGYAVFAAGFLFFPGKTDSRAGGHHRRRMTIWACVYMDRPYKNNFGRGKHMTEEKKSGAAVQILGAVLCVVFGFFLVCNIIIIVKGTLHPETPPTVLGVAPMVVLSGSMSGTAEDHIEVGDLIFTKQADIDQLKVGDVVAFMDGSIVVTHRIVSISADRTEFVTKGDANNTEDEPISADQIIGQYSGRIPKVGDFALFLQKPLGMVIFIGVPVCAFVVWDILRRRRETRAGDEEKEQLRRELERLKAEKPAE